MWFIEKHSILYALIIFKITLNERTCFKSGENKSTDGKLTGTNVSC